LFGIASIPRRGNPMTEVPFPQEISGGQLRAGLLARPNA
jgi:hypothetical protein